MGTIGERLIELDSCESTNKYAADLLASGKAEHGTVILTHEQTAGRGQRGRSWLSKPGKDIAMSVVIRPAKLMANDQFLLGQVAALAVQDVVREAMRFTVGRPKDAVRVKWPNDVLVERKKVAGILVQNEVSRNLIQNSIIGIGLNVNNSELDAGFNATSLRIETGFEQDRMELLRGLCAALETWWERGLADRASVGDAYTDTLWSKGRFAEFELDGSPFSARPVGVDPDGRLIVEDNTGTTHTLGLDRLRFAQR